MAGDKLDIKVDYYISTATTDNSTADGLNTIINALASIIDNSPVTTTFHGSGSTITTDLNSSSPFTGFMQPQKGSTGTTLPKAYLNIIFFDNQFKYVSGESVQVTKEGSGQTIYRIGGNAKVAPKNGFAYIYVSNESNNLVYFDNLQVTHEHGPLLQEDHYYPYGLGMAGISSSAITAAIPNAYKANGGTELGSGEWTDGSGLEMYETTFRSFDAQIGRFMQVDFLNELTPLLNPYRYAFDNPVSWTDPSGLLEEGPQNPIYLPTVYINMPVNIIGISDWETVVDQYGGDYGNGGGGGGGSWGGNNNWGFTGLHGSGNSEGGKGKGPGEKDKKIKKQPSRAVSFFQNTLKLAGGTVLVFGGPEDPVGDVVAGGEVVVGGIIAGLIYVFADGDLDRLAQDIISQDRKGSINREFPDEYRNETLRDIENAAKKGNKVAKKALKLLRDGRFEK